jgi:hypothetical protein
MKTSFLPLFAVLAVAGGCATQTGGTSKPLTEIPFVHFGNINEWQPDGTKGLYIQSDDRKWYYAAFMSPCLDLPYAEGIGFKTTPPLPLSQFDSIIVKGRSCYFKSLDPSDGPKGAKSVAPVASAK